MTKPSDNHNDRVAKAIRDAILGPDEEKPLKERAIEALNKVFAQEREEKKREQEEKEKDQARMTNVRERLSRYADYDQMDEYPSILSGPYAEDANLVDYPLPPFED